MNNIAFIFLLSIYAMLANSQPYEKTILFGDSELLIVGHRGGYDSNLPENSIALFDFTFDNACQKPIAIEFDIRESADGSLFAMHDSTVDRTTNGNGKIALLSANYISTLFLRDRKGNLTSEKIPLFSEVLSHFKDKNIMLMLDVKGDIFPKVIKMVSEMHMESKCIILTFHLKNTQLVKETTSNILVSALIKNKGDWESLLRLQIPNQQLIAYISEDTSPELINEISKCTVHLMTDMSESIRNSSSHYKPDYYKQSVARMQLEILITDYPVHVNKLFCIE